MEYQITENDKKMAREINRVMKVSDVFALVSIQAGTRLMEELEKKGRKDLADYLRWLRKECGMNISDIIPDLEIDDKFSEELKQMENELKN